MADGDAPYHAHIYYAAEERGAAERLRARLVRQAAPGGRILFVGRMCDGPVGPHPVPQFEVHFTEASVEAVTASIAESGLRALVHPLTDDDLADHTRLARWVGAPLALDLATLDPPGRNQGVARFGKSDF